MSLNQPIMTLVWLDGHASEPFGVVLDRAEGGAVPQAAVDHSVDGQEVCHGAGEKTPF